MTLGDRLDSVLETVLLCHSNLHKGDYVKNTRNAAGALPAAANFICEPFLPEELLPATSI